MKGNQEKMTMREEVRSYQFWKAVRCEFLITLLYVLMGTGSGTVWKLPGAGDPSSAAKALASGKNPPQAGRLDTPDPLRVSLGFGLAAATLVQCVGHISGAHLNPAVTLAMLVTRNVTPLRAACYTLAQLCGGIAGAAILYGVTPHDATAGRMGVTWVHPDLGLGQAFGVEFMATFVVVFTVFANLEPKRSHMGSRSLSIGLSVVLAHLFAVSMRILWK